MTFDPFGDFEQRGYLRNIAGEKDPGIVRRLEHTSFTTGIEAAFDAIRKAATLAYSDVLTTHRILFDAVYPWAGSDRLATAPDIAVSKGDVLFAAPADIRRAVEYALRRGQDVDVMRARPGDIMGDLAYAHPFLDGNGRTIMLVHAVLCERADFSIDWARTQKDDYLTALTKELDSPHKGHLNEYLAKFKCEAVSPEELIARIAHTPGIDGSSVANEVLGKTSDPALRARYAQEELKRPRDA